MGTTDNWGHLISGLERSPGVGKGNPLQYSGLDNSMDRGAWEASVHGVTKSQASWATEHTHVITLKCVHCCHSAKQPNYRTLRTSEENRNLSEGTILAHLQAKFELSSMMGCVRFHWEMPTLPSTWTCLPSVTENTYPTQTQLNSLLVSCLKKPLYVHGELVCNAFILLENYFLNKVPQNSSLVR